MSCSHSWSRGKTVGTQFILLDWYKNDTKMSKIGILDFNLHSSSHVLWYMKLSWASLLVWFDIWWCPACSTWLFKINWQKHMSHAWDRLPTVSQMLFSIKIQKRSNSNLNPELKTTITLISRLYDWKSGKRKIMIAPLHELS